MSKHSNVKPPEPEKPPQSEIIEEPPKELPAPLKPSVLKRTSFDSPLKTITPVVAPALKQSIDTLVVSNLKIDVSDNKGLVVRHALLNLHLALT